MNRRTARQNAFIALFSTSFGEAVEEVVAAAREEGAEAPLDEYGAALLHAYAAHADAVDQSIESRLKGWKVSRLSRVSLAILRLAVTEMFYSEEDMDSVAINEAVELAKKYGDEGDYQFVNGVLGSLSREKSGQAGEVADLPDALLPGDAPMPENSEREVPAVDEASAPESGEAVASATLLATGEAPVAEDVATAPPAENAAQQEKPTGPPEAAGE